MAISIRNNTDNLNSKEYQTSSSRGSSVSGANSAGTYINSSRLTGGSTVSGEVLSKDGNNVTIRLSNDQTVNARLDGNADINVGQKLTFEVTKSGINQTVLRPLFSNLSANSAITTALKAAMLPVNDTTVAFTSQMMKEGMPINMNALSDMYKSVVSYPEAKPETIVEMEKIGIPLTDNNITQFENYKNFQHHIIEHVDNMTDGLSDMMKNSISDNVTQSNDMFDFAGKVLDIVNSESLELIDNTRDLEYSNPLVNEENININNYDLTANNTDNTISDINNSIINAENINNNGIEEENILSSDKNTSFDNVQRDLFLNSGLKLDSTQAGELYDDIKDLFDVAGKDLNISSPLNMSAILNDIKEIINNYSSGEYDVKLPADEENSGVTDGNINTQATDSKELENISDKNNTDKNVNTNSENNVRSDDSVAAKSDSGFSLKGIANQVKELSQKILIGDKPEKDIQNNRIIDDSDKSIKERIGNRLSNLLKSDGFNSIIKDSIKSQMSIKPSDISKDGKIEELYQRILRQTSKIAELAESVDKTGSNVAKAATNISDNVNFMNELNHYINYVQLPLKMAGQDAHGELYVYTNQKKLKDNDGNFSALLHLDMDYLGPMDIYVTMQEYTRVNTHFYLESEELLDFIESHIDELTSRLTEKGYNASVNITQKDKNVPITPITEEFKKEDMDSKSGVVAKLCFDVRA